MLVEILVFVYFSLSEKYHASRRLRKFLLSSYPIFSFFRSFNMFSNPYSLQDLNQSIEPILSPSLFPIPSSENLESEILMQCSCFKQPAEILS